MISGDRSLAEDKRGAFYNTLEEFHKHWDRVDIIVPRIKNYELRITNVFGNVFIHTSPWTLIFQPFWIYREGLRILKANGYSLMAKNYLMTVHDYPPFYNGLGAYLLNLATRVPYVLEIHHIPGYPKAANLKEWIYKVFARLFIKIDSSRAKLVRVVNKNQTPDFLIKAGVPEGKIAYISSMYIDLDIFKPMNLPKKYDLIFVGRLAENKGINLLLEAVKLSIINLQFPIKCLIVGDGPLETFCKLKIENWKLRDKVLMYGRAKDSSEIARLLNESKILIMPSYNEGGPRVVVEAMACGVPVLATPVGIAPDLLKNGSGGEIITWDVKDIVLKIRALLNDSDGYKRYGLTGSEIVKQFEKKETIRNYADKLKEILG